MSDAKKKLEEYGLILSDGDKNLCQTYQSQALGLLSRYRVDRHTVCRLVEALLDAGRLMGAEQAVRRHVESERLETEKVKAFIEANKKHRNQKDMNN